jgi:3-oxoacyl-[acyl-carrier protein] reductase
MRNVIVTGGSRGLGLGIARKLIESGFRVIAIARKESDEFAAAKIETEQSHPGSLHFVPFDLRRLRPSPTW